MTDTPSEKREAEERIPKKKDNLKWWLIGGLALVAVLVFYFVNKSNSASTTTSTGALTNPSGYGAFSPFGFGGFGGFGGGTGPAGPAGPAGKRGPRGKTGPAGKGHHHKKHHHHDGNGGDHSGMVGISRMGSRTQALQNVAARRDWNTRIVPSPIRHTYRV